MKRRNVSLSLWALFLLVVVAFGAFMLAHTTSMLDPDMSSELVMSKLLNEEGKPISDSWYYSTEVDVINTQLIYAPLFGLTNNWHAVRLVGNAILTLMLLLSAAFACWRLGIRRMMPLAGILLLSPLCILYFNAVLLGSYYVPQLIFSFVLLGLLAQSIQSCQRRLGTLFALFVVSLASGLNGMRQLALFHAPVLPACLMLMLLYRRSPDAARVRRLLGAYAAALLGGIVGWLINAACLAPRYGVVSNIDEVFPIGLHFQALGEVLGGMGAFFGLRELPFSTQDVLSSLFALGFLTFSAISAVAALRAQSRSPEHALLALTALCGAGVYLAVYTFTSMPYHANYCIPFLIFFCLLPAALLERLPNLRIAFPALLCCLALLFGGSVLSCRTYAYENAALPHLRWFKNDNAELIELADELLAKGYDTGYSTFWHAGNSMTELSNGAIEMYHWNGLGEPLCEKDDIDNLYPWLQKKSHFDQPPQGRFFLMFSTDHVGRFPLLDALPRERLIYQSGNYLVYGFENRADYDACF